MSYKAVKTHWKGPLNQTNVFKSFLKLLYRLVELNCIPGDGSSPFTGKSKRARRLTWILVSVAAEQQRSTRRASSGTFWTQTSASWGIARDVTVGYRYGSDRAAPRTGGGGGGGGEGGGTLKSL